MFNMKVTKINKNSVELRDSKGKNYKSYLPKEALYGLNTEYGNDYNINIKGRKKGNEVFIKEFDVDYKSLKK